MNAEQCNEVWAMLDREQLAGVVRASPQPIFATISGAHLYGFASPDSDVDLRGSFLAPAQSVLGLHPPAETISIQLTANVEIDWVAHDIRKFARLMTSHNGYVLEQLYSPLVVLSTEAHAELLELGRGCVTRPTVKHYQGFARSRRQRLLQPRPTVKHLLYAYRVLLTGIHLMRTGEVISNLVTLNQFVGIAEIDELVARKRAGAETMQLEACDLPVHASMLDRLESLLVDAHATSDLPEEPTTTVALEDFVVRLRLATAGGAVA